MEDPVSAVRETVLGVKIGDHRILLRLDVFALDKSKAVFLRRAHYLVDDEFLHPAFQHTATHQELIDKQRTIVTLFEDDNRDEAVVAELVFQSKIQCNEVVVLGNALDIALRVADRAEIELVGALRELRDSGEMERIERFGISYHFQTLQILVVGGEGRGGFRPLSFLAVLLRALGVLTGNGDRLEKIFPAEEVKIFFGFLRKLGHGQLRDLAADSVALKRIVVDENDAVHADVQRLADMADVAGLVLPVRHEHDEIVLAEDHLRVFAEGLDGGRMFVFAAYRQQNAAIAEFLEVSLQIGIDLAVFQLADADPVHAVVADDAAPERVVKVKDDAFAEMPGKCLHRIENAADDLRQEFDLDRHLGDVEQLRIVEGIASDLSGERVQGDGECLFVLCCRLGEQHVQPAYLVDERLFRLQPVVSENAVVDLHEVELKNRGFRPCFDPPPVFLNPGDNPVGERFLFGGRQVAEFQIQFFRTELDQNVIRRERKQFGVRVERLRFQLVVIGVENIKCDLELIRIAAQCLTQQLRRAVAQNRQFDFLEAGRVLLQIFLEPGKSNLFELFHRISPESCFNDAAALPIDIFEFFQ